MSAQHAFKSLSVPVVLGLCLLVAACTPSKATQANYDKVLPLMTRDQVNTLLGEPDSVDAPDSNDPNALVTETWRAKTYTITVTFSDGQMIFKDLHNKI